MTGFGYSETTIDKVKYTISIKSVNSKYIDININLPPNMHNIEESLVKTIKSIFDRGKFDVYIGIDRSTTASRLVLNEHLLEEYLKLIRRIKRIDPSVESGINVADIMNYNGVVISKQESKKVDFDKHLKKSFLHAVNHLKKMRLSEGRCLQGNFLNILSKMRNSLNKVKKRLPGILKTYHEKIKSRIDSLVDKKKYDENRILMEVALLSDKM
ncbi:MAG: hypothetical protein KKH98_04505, partial [Spirochaetes bacterium]|nr:hypothetical protein [Spirochaetota bacterium]